MELDVPTAIRAQLVSLPDDEREAILADLRRLAAQPERLRSAAAADASDDGAWVVHLSPQLRALVREDGDHLRVLAVASLDQLRPYLGPGGKRAA